MTTDPLLYSIPDVCRLMGVSRSWLYRQWDKDAGPPRIWIDGRVFIPVEKFREWLDALIAKATAQPDAGRTKRGKGAPHNPSKNRKRSNPDRGA